VSREFLKGAEARAGTWGPSLGDSLPRETRNGRQEPAERQEAAGSTALGPWTTGLSWGSLNPRENSAANPFPLNRLRGIREPSWGRPLAI